MFIGDMSQYQPETVNFSQLKASLDFVILRDQFGYTIKDSHYDAYVKGCESVGLPFNTYAFFDAVSVSDAVAEADSDIKRMAARSVVAWIDIEKVTVKSGTDSELWAAGNAYYQTLKKAGFQKVGLYSGEYFYNTHKLYNINHDCLWIAKYNANDGKLNLAERPGTPCDIWQFTSVGSVAGISPIDLSVLVGSKPLSYFTGVPDVVAKPLAVASPPPPAPVHTNIVIPSLSGLSLGAVENYIKGYNWWMTATVEKGDTITIETGIFDKGSKAYQNFLSFLDALGVAHTEKAPS